MTGSFQILEYCRHCPNVPLFAGKSRFFTRNVPLKTFSRLAGLSDLPTVPLLAGQSRFFYQMSRVPLNHGNVPLFVRSRIFLRAQFVTLPRCPDVNANHPIERNYGNFVRFLAKIPNGTAAESPCYSVFWNAIDFCRLYTSKK